MVRKSGSLHALLLCSKNFLFCSLESRQCNSHHSQVESFSSNLKRNDDLELNAKVLKTNQLLEEKLLLSGLDLNNNDNIRYGNI